MKATVIYMKMNCRKSDLILSKAITPTIPEPFTSGRGVPPVAFWLFCDGISLEGMQFGAPTLTTCSTSIEEVAGKAAILLDPEDTEGWAQVMQRLVANTDERDQLGLAAHEQAKWFDWKLSAAALLKLYEEALAAPKGFAVS